MMQEDHNNDKGGAFFAVFTGLKRSPLILGTLLGVLLLGGYGVFFASEPPPPKINVVYVDTQMDKGEATSLAPTLPLNDEDESVSLVAEAPEEPLVPITARFALVLADTGLQRRVIEAIESELPAQVGVAVSVYTPNLQNTIDALAKRGHELWLQLATQGRGAEAEAGIDGGPLALYMQGIEGENKSLLSRQFSSLSQPQNLRGVYVRSDADITYNNAIWRALARDVMGRNLMVLEGTPALVASDLYLPSSSGEPSAYLKPKEVIKGGAELLDSLSALSGRIVGGDAQIVVIENLSAGDITLIANWLKSLEAQGVGLVAASHYSNL